MMMIMTTTITTTIIMIFGVDSRVAPSQWETALLYNDASHWLSTSLESALDINNSNYNNNDNNNNNDYNNNRRPVIKGCNYDIAWRALSRAEFCHMKVLLQKSTVMKTIRHKSRLWTQEWVESTPQKYILLIWLMIYGWGHEGAAVLLPGFAINW